MKLSLLYILTNNYLTKYIFFFPILKHNVKLCPLHFFLGAVIVSVATLLLSIDNATDALLYSVSCSIANG